MAGGAADDADEARRGPLIASPHLDDGELLFCFIGQVSSRAGTPLIVDTLAVSFRKGGRFEISPLKEALAEAQFERLANTGRTSKLREDLLRGFVESAITQSLHHLRQPKYLPPEGKRATRLRTRLEEMEVSARPRGELEEHPPPRDG